MADLFGAILGRNPDIQQQPQATIPETSTQEEVRARAEYYNQLENVVQFLNTLITPTVQDVQKVQLLLNEMSTSRLTSEDIEYLEICNDAAEIALMLQCPKAAISEMKDIARRLLMKRSDANWFTDRLLAVNIRRENVTPKNEGKKGLGI